MRSDGDGLNIKWVGIKWILWYNGIMNKLNCFSSSSSSVVSAGKKNCTKKKEWFFEFINLDWRLVVKDEFNINERLGEMKSYVLDNYDLLGIIFKNKAEILEFFLQEKHFFTLSNSGEGKKDDMIFIKYINWGKYHIKKIMQKVTKNKKTTNTMIWVYLLLINFKDNNNFSFKWEEKV